MGRRAWLASLVIAWGCEEPSTPNDTMVADTGSPTTGDDDDDATEADETGSDGPCGGGQCGAMIPEGWIGPVVRSVTAQGATPPECPEAWPDKDLSFFDEYIEPGPASCACSCEVDYLELCYTGLWRHDGSATCESYTEFLALDGDACQTITPTTGSVDLEVIGAGAPDCGPVMDTDIPEPGWGNLVTACRLGDDPEPCDPDGICLPSVPDGFDPGVCVYRQGDEECPGDPWTARALVYNGVAQDSRNCSPCSCGEVGALTCAGVVTPFASEDCSGREGTSVGPDSCGTVDAAASVRLDFDGPQTCEMLTDTMLQGSIDPGPVFTYCCTEAGA